MGETSKDPSGHLDLAHLQAMTGGDVGLAVEVLDIFRGQADAWGRLLDPRAEAEQWADAAHTLKGAALSIGAGRLAAICAQTETLGRGDPVSPAHASLALNDLRNELNAVRESVARLAHTLSVAGAFRASNASNS